LQAQLVKARADRDAAQRNFDALTRFTNKQALHRRGSCGGKTLLAARMRRVKLLEAKTKERYSRPEVARVEASTHRQRVRIWRPKNVLASF